MYEERDEHRDADQGYQDSDPDVGVKRLNGPAEKAIRDVIVSFISKRRY